MEVVSNHAVSNDVRRMMGHKSATEECNKLYRSTDWIYKSENPFGDYIRSGSVVRIVIHTILVRFAQVDYGCSSTQEPPKKQSKPRVCKNKNMNKGDPKTSMVTKDTVMKTFIRAALTKTDLIHPSGYTCGYSSRGCPKCKKRTGPDKIF